MSASKLKPDEVAVRLYASTYALERRNLSQNFILTVHTAEGFRAAKQILAKGASAEKIPLLNEHCTDFEVDRRWYAVGAARDFVAFANRVKSTCIAGFEHDEYFMRLEKLLSLRKAVQDDMNAVEERDLEALQYAPLRMKHVDKQLMRVAPDDVGTAPQRRGQSERTPFVAACCDEVAQLAWFATAPRDAYNDVHDALLADRVYTLQHGRGENAALGTEQFLAFAPVLASNPTFDAAGGVEGQLAGVVQAVATLHGARGGILPTKPVSGENAVGVSDTGKLLGDVLLALRALGDAGGFTLLASGA